MTKKDLVNKKFKNIRPSIKADIEIEFEDGIAYFDIILYPDYTIRELILVDYKIKNNKGGDLKC